MGITAKLSRPRSEANLLIIVNIASRGEALAEALVVA